MLAARNNHWVLSVIVVVLTLTSQVQQPGHFLFLLKDALTEQDLDKSVQTIQCCQCNFLHTDFGWGILFSKFLYLWHCGTSLVGGCHGRQQNCRWCCAQFAISWEGSFYRLFLRILVILPSSISHVKPLDRPLYRMLQSSVDPCMGRFFFLSIRCGWAAEMQQTWWRLWQEQWVDRAERLALNGAFLRYSLVARLSYIYLTGSGIMALKTWTVSIFCVSGCKQGDLQAHSEARLTHDLFLQKDADLDNSSTICSISRMVTIFTFFLVGHQR